MFCYICLPIIFNLWLLLWIVLEANTNIYFFISLICLSVKVMFDIINIYCIYRRDNRATTERNIRYIKVSRLIALFIFMTVSSIFIYQLNFIHDLILESKTMMAAWWISISMCSLYEILTIRINFKFLRENRAFITLY